MMHTTGEHPRDGWESIGRAAEHFARRVARDAGKFAERMEEHASEFAHDVSRDWHRRRRHHRHAGRVEGEADVRRIFEDIRTVLADVLDGVNELIERVFATSGETPHEDWVRLVSNRDSTCAGCGHTVAAGDEAYARRTGEGQEFRCLGCGVPSAAGG